VLNKIKEIYKKIKPLLNKISKTSFLISLMIHSMMVGIRIGIDFLGWEISKIPYVVRLLALPYWFIILASVPLIIGIILTIRRIWK
jgi:hypothetical protein